MLAQVISRNRPDFLRELVGRQTPMDQKPDLQHLSRIFKNYPDVQAVYVFGSSASGHTHADSDLDLAVVPRHPRVHSRKLDMLADLARAGFCDVDLVFLDMDDIVKSFPIQGGQEQKAGRPKRSKNSLRFNFNAWPLPA